MCRRSSRTRFAMVLVKAGAQMAAGSAGLSRETRYQSPCWPTESGRDGARCPRRGGDMRRPKFRGLGGRRTSPCAPIPSQMGSGACRSRTAGTSSCDPIRPRGRAVDSRAAAFMSPPHDLRLRFFCVDEAVFASVHRSPDASSTMARAPWHSPRLMETTRETGRGGSGFHSDSILRERRVCDPAEVPISRAGGLGWALMQLIIEYAQVRRN